MPIDKSLISLVGEIEEDVTDLAKKVALTVQRSWVLGTPVDTGRNRGGVHVSVGYQSNAETGARDVSGNATLGKGANQISRAKLGQTINIQNAVPYTAKLEAGFSPQNRGFIKLAFLNGALVAKNG